MQRSEDRVQEALHQLQDSQVRPVPCFAGLGFWVALPD